MNPGVYIITFLSVDEFYYIDSCHWYEISLNSMQNSEQTNYGTHDKSLPAIPMKLLIVYIMYCHDWRSYYFCLTLLTDDISFYILIHFFHFI